MVGQAPLQTVVHKDGLHHERVVLIGGDNILRRDIDHVDLGRHVGLDGVHIVLKGLELPGIACLHADALTAFAAGQTRVADPVVQSELRRRGKVDPLAGAPVEAAGPADILTAGTAVVIGCLQVVAVARHDRDTGIVIEIGGKTGPARNAVQGLQQKLIWILPVNADAQRGLEDMSIHVGFDDEIGQVVGRIIAELIAAAHQNVLERRVACQVLRRVAVREQEDVVGLDVEQLEQLHSFCPGHDSLPDILLIQGPQVLIHSAVGQQRTGAVVIEGAHHQPDGLEGLPEGTWGIMRHIIADGCDLLILLLKRRVGSNSGLFPHKLRPPVREALHGLQDQDCGLVEELLSPLLQVVIVVLIQLFLGIGLIGVGPLGDDLRPVQVHVGSINRQREGDLAEVCADDLVLDLLRTGLTEFGHQGPLFPVGRNLLFKLPLLFGGRGTGTELPGGQALQATLLHDPPGLHLGV